MKDSLLISRSKIEAFNEKNPVGSSVILIKDFGEKFKTKVRHPATITSSGGAVAWLENVSGYWLLERVI